MEQLDSIDSKLKERPEISDGEDKRRDRDEEAMMKDFGDVSMSDQETGAEDAPQSGSANSLESLDSELYDTKKEEDDEEEHHTRKPIANK